MRNWLLCVGALLALCLSEAGYAQNVFASIQGNVTDASGAALPDAVVVIRNLETGLERKSVTDNHGTYSLNLLPIGTYALSANHAGFRDQTVTGIVLQTDEHARRDIALAVGSADEHVTVESSAPIIQTDNASISEVVNDTEITELPMNGRNLNQLALITGGVTPGNQSQPEAGNASTNQTFSVAGGRTNTNGFLIDGVSNTDDAIDNGSLHPSLEMVREFRLETNNYSAEFGQYSGGQLNVSTKSGTDKFHGSLFEFVRNDALDAKNYFVLSTQSKPPLNRNQFGGSFGGPIFKQKLFFFTSYEGLRLTQGQTGTGTVPTAALLGGDFSALLQANNPYTHTVTQLIDPATQKPIPGNLLLPGQISKVGAAIAGLYPAQTVAGAATNNYTVNPSLLQNDDTYNGRLDYQIRSQDTLSGRETHLSETLNQPYPLGAGASALLGYGSVQPSQQDNAFIGETHIFSPTLLNEAKVGLSRIVLSVANQNSSNVTGALGITGLDPAAYASYSGTPTLSVSSFATIGAVNFFPQIRADTTYQFSDSLTWVRGRHSMKFGVNLVHFQLYQNVNVNVRGTFTFSGQYSGFSLADLLLGYPSQTSKLQLPGPLWSYGVNASRSVFAQDNWQASKRLTVNLGVRYDVYPPVYYKGGQQAGFNPTLGVIQIPKQSKAGINPLTNPAPIPIPVPIQEVGGKTICNEDRNNFGPRLGAAFRPFGDSKTVVRGGYGIFYNMPFTNTSCGSSSLLWQYSESFIGSLKGSTPTISLSNPFPSALLTSAFTPTANYPDQHPTPLVQQYNFDVEQQLTGSIGLEIAYLGSSGLNLPLALNINQAAQGTGSVNSRRPYAGLGLLNSITVNGYGGSSNYNGLLVHVEKRTTNGATFLVNYTYSHAIDSGASGIQNVYNIRGNRGESPSDIRHRLVGSYVYRLPFGQKQRFGAHWNRVVDAALGGWQSAGIFTYQTGFALTSSVSGLDNSQTGGLNDRPNVVASTSLPNPSRAKWFNTSAFALASAGQFGNERTGAIVGPGLVNLDISFQKNFRIREAQNLELRGELFNSLNHPNFLNPNTTFNSATFGTITGAGTAREVQFGLRYAF